MKVENLSKRETIFSEFTKEMLMEVSSMNKMKTIFSEFKDQALNAELGKLNVIESPVASGKSYAITEQIAKFCIDKLNNELIIISQPYNCIWKEEDKERLKQKGLKEYERFLDIFVAIENGTFERGFIMTTPNTLGRYIESSNEYTFMNLVLGSLKDKVAVFIDEIHCHSVSNFENYEFCKGKTTNITNQFKFFNKGLVSISKYTKYLFGFTATPHKENKNEIFSGLVVDYRDVTPKRSNRLNWSKCTSVNLHKDMFDSLEDKIQNLLVFNSASNVDKKTAMFQCRSAQTKKTEFTLYGEGFVDGVLLETCRKIPHEYRNLKIIIVDTSTSTYSISPQEILDKGCKDRDNWEKEKINQDEVYRRLGSPDSPEQILFCVEKHQLGSNIPTLSEIFSFKEFNYEYKNIIYIDKLIQLYGRGVRVNLPKEYKKEYSRNLFELLTSNFNDVDELNRILDLNSCTINLMENKFTSFFKNWHDDNAVTPDFVKSVIS
jgi:hypothetical protein